MYTDIKTVEDAFKVVGLDIANQPDVSMLPERHQKHVKAQYNLAVVAEAVNEGWKPDWTKVSQRKYYPWWDLSSGSGLSFDDYVCVHSYSAVGSRLCYVSYEVAEHVAEHFKELYEDLMVLS